MATTQLPQPYGKYILLNKIALGGMAEIFRAKTLGAEGFEKQVVIKRILPHFTEDEAFVTMFIDEAKVSSGLNHPNIVQIYDFDLQEETYYISMEYIEGKDLKRVMDKGVKDGDPLSVAQVVFVTMATCRGLHYAHTKKKNGQPLNIIHRDVSPHNVMVSYDGDVKVMDFGIAKAAARSTKTRAGTVKGKCAYMSPEQARGKHLDSRSDMFAVGVMAWEMLTHRRLFAGDSDFETLSNVLKAEVPPPSSINDKVPPELDAILLKCLAKDREDRQADCKALMRELEQWFYASVTDHEAAELGWYMQQMFIDDIKALREMQQADNTKNIAEVSQAMRAGRSGSSSSHPARHSTESRMNQAHPPVKPAGGGQLNDARTVALDVSAQQLAGLPADRTIALDPSSTGHQVSGERKKSNAGLWVMLFLLLCALGVGGWFGYQHLMRTPPAAKADSGKQVAANGTGTTQETTGGPTTGDSTGDAPGTDGTGVEASGTGSEPAGTGDGTGAGTNGASDSSGTGGEPAGTGGTADGTGASTEMVDKTDATGEPTDNSGTGEAPPPTDVTVIIAVIPAGAMVQVPGKALEKRPGGSFALKAKVGDKLSVLATHAEHERKTMSFSVESDNQMVSIVMEKKAVATPPTSALAKVELTVVPTNATLSVGGQAMPKAENGIYMLNVKLGEKLAVKIAANKHKSVTDTINVITTPFAKTYKLEKKKEPPKGPGKAKFDARPWAQVTVKGKSCPSTPCSMTLQSGSYTAVFKKNAIRKVKRFRVRPGQTTKVFANMK